MNLDYSACTGRRVNQFTSGGDAAIAALGCLAGLKPVAAAAAGTCFLAGSSVVFMASFASCSPVSTSDEVSGVGVCAALLSADAHCICRVRKAFVHACVTQRPTGVVQQITSF